MSELHDLVAAYAVDAVEPAERAEFEAHLAGCARCRARLAALGPATVALGEAVAATPPEAMRQSVLEAVAATPQEGVVPRMDRAAELRDRRGRRFRQWAVGLGAAAILVTAVAVASLTGGRAPTIDEVAGAPDAASIALEGEVGAARFVYSDSLDAGVFTSDRLPNVGTDETYQLWLIDDSGASPVGVFTPEAGGVVEFVVIADISPGQVLGMTVEPAGGSPAPTGEVLLAEPLT